MGKISSALLLLSTFLPSFLRVFLLGMLGHKIGRNVRISILTIILSFGFIAIQIVSLRREILRIQKENLGLRKELVNPVRKSFAF